jgi:hypothetical protein
VNIKIFDYSIFKGSLSNADGGGQSGQFGGLGYAKGLLRFAILRLPSWYQKADQIFRLGLHRLIPPKRRAGILPSFVGQSGEQDEKYQGFSVFIKKL